MAKYGVVAWMRGLSAGKRVTCDQASPKQKGWKKKGGTLQTAIANTHSNFQGVIITPLVGLI